MTGSLNQTLADLVVSNKLTLEQRLLNVLNREAITGDFRTIWEQFERIIVDTIEEFIISSQLNIPKSAVERAPNKSTYPDLKILHQGRLFAFEVKSGEAKKSPEFDMSRLDTYVEDHLDIYAEEYVVVVKWELNTHLRVNAVYLETTHHAIGTMKDKTSVKYRLKDGNVRPKSWQDFEARRSYFESREHLRAAMIQTRESRWHKLILDWYGKMPQHLRVNLRRALDEFDQ